MPAASVDVALAGRMAVLLSRAFTDEARVADYTPEERERWDSDVRRVRASDPRRGERMPPEWMDRFPTVRNLRLSPEQRLPATHLLIEADAYLTGHVAVFERSFTVGGHPTFRAGFIEDVATEPNDGGQGLATRLMREAAVVGLERGYPLLALSTRIPGFYERLGWSRWPGEIVLTGRVGTRAIDRGMTRALSAQGERFLATADGRSFVVEEPGARG